MKIFKVIPSPQVKKEHSAPIPLKKLIPEWYKRAEKYYKENGKDISGLKTCLPFLDAMTLGYALVVPVDVTVSKNEDGDLSITWDKSLIDYHVVNERKGLIGHTIPRPSGHLNNHLVWNCQWGWKVPKGYSVAVTHPLNRFELPFTTMSGVVDSDEFFNWGNIPFFIREGFEGVIPAGTPIAQLIPFKRATWSLVQDWLSTDSAVDVSPVLRAENGVYRKLWRKVKEF